MALSNLTENELATIYEALIKKANDIARYGALDSAASRDAWQKRARDIRALAKRFLDEVEGPPTPIVTIEPGWDGNCPTCGTWVSKENAGDV